MKKLCILFLTVLGSYITNAQSVGINDDGSTPDGSAILDVKSLSKGFLAPRMTASQRSGISNPATGLMVYQTDGTAGVYVNKGTPAVPNWILLVAANSVWSLTGNAGNTAANFIGTTDNQPLIFKVNNGLAGQINSSLLANANNNVSFGLGALNSNVFNTGSPSLGNFNVAIGNAALFYNTSGSHNVAVGLNALTANTSGNQNTANGNFALQSNTEGFGNTGLGYTALSLNQTGSNNTALGGGALYTNITGGFNTAVGTSSLKFNQAGTSNTAVGYAALFSSTADNNTAVGYSALFTNTIGLRNTAMGMIALNSNTLGNDNTATGHAALQSNTTGSLNTATGNQALSSNTEGFYNSAHGYQSLLLNTTGTYNTAIGSGALVTNTEGLHNTALGSFADVTLPNLANATAIGYNAKVSQSNALVLGDNVNVGIGTSSPNTTSLLELSSNSKGILIPRMSTTDRNAILSPATGLLVYDNSLNSFYYHNGSTWAKIGNDIAASVWLLNGNAGTNPAAQFIGTTDAKPLLLKVNNILAGQIQASNSNTGFGLGTLASTTGNENTAMGYHALYSNTSGNNNTAFGKSTLSSNTTGLYNAAFGVNALEANTTGENNTALGGGALNANTTGEQNTATGHVALLNNTTGSYNTANGSASLLLNTSGAANTATGYWSLRSNTTGSLNTANGYSALYSNTTGFNNIGVGYQSLYINTTGYSNTASGHQALYSNTTGFLNAGHGYRTLYSNTTGSYNTANGNGAMSNNTTGSYNSVNGATSLFSNSVGSYNTANGFESLYSNNESYNTAFGSYALRNTNASQNNTAIGYRAGYSFNNGWNNTFLGANTDVNAADMFNCIAIGQDVICTASNQVRVGNTSTNSLFCQGAYASTTSASANMVVNSAGQIMRSTSSARYKAAIADLDINTENIYQLQPRSYTSINDGQKYFGLVAEEVHKVIPELVEYAKEKEVIPGSKSEHLIPDAVRYPMLSVLLLKEMQKHQKTLGEQQTIIDKQNDELKKLKEQVDALAKMIQTLSANK